VDRVTGVVGATSSGGFLVHCVSVHRTAVNYFNVILMSITSQFKTDCKDDIGYVA